MTKRCCHISYHSDLGRGIKFPHPLGIVIGEGVVIKDNVQIWQHVTLGSSGKKGEGLTYPTIQDGVKIYTGAVLLGKINVGANAVVGANSVVNTDVPENSVVAGIPAKIISTAN